MRALPWRCLLTPSGVYAGEESPEVAVSALWQVFFTRPRTGCGRRDAGAALPCKRGDLRRPPRGRPARPRAHGLADSLKSSGQVGEEGFYECETQRSIETCDRFAVAYSVESRRDRSSA